MTAKHAERAARTKKVGRSYEETEWTPSIFHLIWFVPTSLLCALVMAAAGRLLVWLGNRRLARFMKTGPKPVVDLKPVPPSAKKPVRLKDLPYD